MLVALRPYVAPRGNVLLRPFARKRRQYVTVSRAGGIRRPATLVLLPECDYNRQMVTVRRLSPTQ